VLCYTDSVEVYLTRRNIKTEGQNNAKLATTNMTRKCSHRLSLSLPAF